MSGCDGIRDRYFAGSRVERGAPELEAHLAACPACQRAAEALPRVAEGLAALRTSAAAPPIPPFERVAAAAALAARARRRQRQIRRWRPFVLTGAAAAAAAALALTAVRELPLLAPEEAEISAAAAEAAVEQGVRTMVLDSGTRVELAGARFTALPRVGGEERLFLEDGSLDLEVPKLSPGQAVSVSTPDAEVRVRGTRLRVGRGPLGTTVSVVEGLVEVQPIGGDRPLVTLGAGESVVVEPLDVYREGLYATALEALGRGELEASERLLLRLLGAAPGQVERARAQALLAWTSAAAGDRRTAVERYRLALSLLPENERALWAENACAELALLLEQIDPPAARAAWAEYLERYPHGVHAAQARARGRRAGER